MTLIILQHFCEFGHNALKINRSKKIGVLPEFRDKLCFFAILDKFKGIFGKFCAKENTLVEWTRISSTSRFFRQSDLSFSNVWLYIHKNSNISSLEPYL